MEYVADIEVGWTPVKARARARNIWRAQSFVRAAIEEVTRVRHRLGPGVGDEIAQTIRKLLFNFGLQAAVIAVPNGPLVAAALAEIGKRNKRRRTYVGRQN